MPINRPNLKKLPCLSIKSTYAGASRPNTNEYLKNNIDTLHNKMRNMPISHFKEALDVPDYSGMRQIDLFSMSQGFQLNKNSNDVFIHACRHPLRIKANLSVTSFTSVCRRI